jgi:two-component system chemotaxis response regulator CheY
MMALRKDLRLLIVDDMAVSRQILTQILEQLGLVDVRSAHSGHEALERLAQHPADIVIADLNMPEMDGIKLLQQVRSDRRCHATRFVLASGNDADPRIDEARMNGMDRFLPKPFCADRLIRVLESVSGRL